MRQKHDYLIWREKNGFFSALDRKGSLHTWSMVTGKLLYSERQKENEAASGSSLDAYDVYKSDDRDISYTQNNYCLEDCSLTLLKKRSPL